MRKLWSIKLLDYLRDYIAFNSGNGHDSNSGGGYGGTWISIVSSPSSSNRCHAKKKITNYKRCRFSPPPRCRLPILTYLPSGFSHIFVPEN